MDHCSISSDTSFRTPPFATSAHVATDTLDGRQAARTTRHEHGDDIGMARSRSTSRPASPPISSPPAPPGVATPPDRMLDLAELTDAIRRVGSVGSALTHPHSNTSSNADPAAAPLIRPSRQSDAPGNNHRVVQQPFNDRRRFQRDVRLSRPVPRGQPASGPSSKRRCRTCRRPSRAGRQRGPRNALPSYCERVIDVPVVPHCAFVARCPMRTVRQRAVGRPETRPRRGRHVLERLYHRHERSVSHHLADRGPRLVSVDGQVFVAVDGAGSGQPAHRDRFAWSRALGLGVRGLPDRWSSRASGSRHEWANTSASSSDVRLTASLAQPPSASATASHPGTMALGICWME